MSLPHLLCALVLVNVLTFLCYGVDKWRARANARIDPERQGHSAHSRIAESTLLILGSLGILGALLGMLIFNHKTNGERHPLFVYGLPLLMLVEYLGFIHLVELPAALTVLGINLAGALLLLPGLRTVTPVLVIFAIAGAPGMLGALILARPHLNRGQFALLKLLISLSLAALAAALVLADLGLLLLPDPLLAQLRALP